LRRRALWKTEALGAKAGSNKKGRGNRKEVVVYFNDHPLRQIKKELLMAKKGDAKIGKNCFLTISTVRCVPCENQTKRQNKHHKKNGENCSSV